MEFNGPTSRSVTRWMMVSWLSVSAVSMGCDDSAPAVAGDAGTAGAAGNTGAAGANAAGTSGTAGIGGVTALKDIVDTAVAASSFKTLAAALTAADLVTTLKCSRLTS